MFFVLLRCSETVKFTLQDFAELHRLSAFLVFATIDSGFQELQGFGNNVAELFHKIYV